MIQVVVGPSKEGTIVAVEEGSIFRQLFTEVDRTFVGPSQHLLYLYDPLTRRTSESRAYLDIFDQTVRLNLVSEEGDYFLHAPLPEQGSAAAINYHGYPPGTHEVAGIIFDISEH